MADIKISALPSATTPLAGTEVLPIVQSSTTKNVAVSDLTAGRAVSAASLSLTTSPLPATSGGTGQSSAFTANGVAYASSTSALATGTTLAFDGTNLSVGAAWTTNPFRTTAPQYFQYGSSGTTKTIVSDGSTLLQVLRFSTNSGSPTITLGKSRGTYASPSAVSTSDLLGIINFRGYGGTNTRTLVEIFGSVDTYVSDTNISSKLSFATTPAGTASTVTRMVIDPGGNISSTSGTTGMTDGFFYIPAAAGAPTGVPTAISGAVPMYYDKTNNDFYVYNGAWKKVTLT